MSVNSHNKWRARLKRRDQFSRFPYGKARLADAISMIEPPLTPLMGMLIRQQAEMRHKVYITTGLPRISF